MTYCVGMRLHTPPISETATTYPPTPAGPVPFGYRRLNPMGFDKFSRPCWRAPDEREAAIVSQLFIRLADGYSLARILHEFEREGKFRRDGKPLTRPSALAILRNPTYRGARIDEGTPAIIPPDLFGIAQQILGMPERRVHQTGNNRVKFLLSGIALCGECGRPMRGKVATRQDGRIERTYRCYQFDEHTVERSQKFVDDAARDALIEFADDPRGGHDPIFNFARLRKSQRRENWDMMPLKTRRALVQNCLVITVNRVGKGQHRSPEGVTIERRA